MKSKQMSLVPATQECERFIKFLSKKFEEDIPTNLMVYISNAGKNILGYFASPDVDVAFHDATGKKVPTILINSIHLKEDPYETLAHEFAHFINYKKGINDCSSNQYHNKHFKIMAEKFLLKVEKQRGRGWARTIRTDEFDEMLKEFKADEDVFDMFQGMRKPCPSATRMKLFSCDNECIKIRCAKLHFEGTKCNVCGQPYVLRD